MRVGDKLFVYGTLRPHGERDSSLMEGAVRIGPDRIKGSIYHLGGFPGVKLDSDDDRVIGDVYEVVDASLPPRLDRYEGYPNLYTREVVETVDEGHNVWVYIYNGEVRPNMRIQSGDWKNA